MKRSFLLALLGILAAAQASAQEIERFLVPIAGNQIAGANGSLWEVELWYRNESDIPVVVQPSSLTSPNAEARVTRRVVIPDPAGGRTLFLSVPRQVADSFRVQMLIRDLSRRHETWGTELPAVRERDFFSRKLTLLNVPTDSSFRQALRIYESELASHGLPPGRAKIDFYANDGNQILATTDVLLTNPLPAFFLPGFAQILSLTDAFPAIRAVDRVRIEITPLTEGARIWAFVSVTHNETQHVTTITP